MDPNEAKSHCAAGGTHMGQSACSSEGESDSSAHEREKPGGASGLHLGTRASSSGGVASSDSDVVSSLGMVKLTGGFTWPSVMVLSL